MTRTRIFLIAAALIAAAGAAEWLVLTLWSVGVEAVEFVSGELQGDVFTALSFWNILGNVLHCAAFGLGVYLALRYLRPIYGQTPWRQAFTRSILATVGGVLVATVLNFVVTLIGAVTLGQYPFGYSVNPEINLNGVQFGLLDAAEGLLPTFVGWLPLTVLGCVLLRFWLQAHPPVEATVPASPVETPATR
jgi:hypothetical protein